MHLIKKLSLTLAAGLVAVSAFAQSEEASGKPEAPAGTRFEMKHDFKSEPSPVARWYFGGNFDGAIFSTAIFERPGLRRQTTPLRFSMIGIGTNFNYDFDEHFGIFTGVSIKNVGFIEKMGDSTVKRRLYTAGIPLGIKIGNLQKRNYVFLGGGVDFPINYREKGFVDRGNKEKFNEFWSERVEWYQPHLFVGAAFRGSTVKVQYYTGNFFNTDFENTYAGVKQKPYQGWRAQMLYVTLGMDLHKKSHSKKHEEAPAEEDLD